MSIPSLDEDLVVSNRGEILQKVLEERPPTFGLLQSYNNWVDDILPQQPSLFVIENSLENSR